MPTWEVEFSERELNLIHYALRINAKALETITTKQKVKNLVRAVDATIAAIHAAKRERRRSLAIERRANAAIRASKRTYKPTYVKQERTQP